jgi:hypothetical protein
MNLMVQVWAWQGRYTRRRHLAVHNTARFWLAALVVWLLTFAVLYLTPHLS